MKRILTALTLFAAIGAPALATSQEEKPLGSAEIVENGKILFEYNPHEGSSLGWAYIQLNVVYQGDYYSCEFDNSRISCVELISELAKPLKQD